MRGVEQGVVDQAVMYSLLDSAAVFLAQRRGNFHFNLKIVQTRRILGFVSEDMDEGAFDSQLVFLQILRGVKARAGTQRRQQELRRSHALVEAAVFGRLVARNSVLPCPDFELHASQMFN